MGALDIIETSYLLQERLGQDKAGKSDREAVRQHLGELIPLPRERDALQAELGKIGRVAG